MSSGKSLDPDVDNKKDAADNLLTKDLEAEILGPEADTFCGIGCIKGERLQALAKPLTYLLVSSIIALIQGTYFTYSNATLSTVEKRFRLPSKISGFITTGNDLVQLVLSIHITFLASSGHRPRWLAFGMFLSAVGCFLASLPHFIFGAGNLLELMMATKNGQGHSLTTEEVPQLTEKEPKRALLCNGESNHTESCEADADTVASNELYTVVILQLVAQMLSGYASMLYYTIGYSYLDEAVAKDKVPLFFAVSGSVRLVGPILGYTLAGWSLKQWVLPEQVGIPITPDHPRWIGAWWIGYLIIGSCLLGVTWWLVLMPKMLPGTRRRKLKELHEAALRGRASFQKMRDSLRCTRSQRWKELRPTVCRILKNRVYFLITMNQVLFWFSFFGYITFKSKYLEHQFRMSASAANQYIAGVSLGAAFAGWLGTGATLSCLKPSSKVVIILMATLSAISCSCHIVQMSIKCDHGDVIGLQEVLSQERPTSGATPSCWRNCSCSSHFSPVCATTPENPPVFFSPCHAGCKTLLLSNTSTVYSECSCIPKDATHTAQDTSCDEETSKHVVGTAKDGLCPLTCNDFVLYLAVSVIAKMAQAASRVPVNLVLFRCVAERDKDVGLGIFNAGLALLASIPAPIVFGLGIDNSCLLWENKCGNKGFCWIYDMDGFRNTLHGIPSALLALCLITDLLLLRYHRRISFYGLTKDKDHSRDDNIEMKLT